MKTLFRAVSAWLIAPLAVVGVSACVSNMQPPQGPPPPGQRLQSPPPAPAEGVGQAQAARMLQLRAEAMYADGRPVPATAALVQREQDLQGDADAIQRNRDAIWNGLNARPLANANLTGLKHADNVTRGWVELAVLAQQGASLRQYQSWQQSYPDHPAADRLPALMMPGAAPLLPASAGSSGSIPQPLILPPTGPGPTALLLPLSGSLAGVAKLLRQGYTDQARREGDTRTPQVYDDGVSSNGGDAADAVNAPLQQALNDGAGVVVGPLQKAAVAALAQGGALPVPVLALNYLDDGAVAPPGLLQFGLAPEDEARQAADNAYAAGLRQAVALVPDDARGSRILNAFTKRLQTLGGHVVASAQYSTSTTDFSAQVRGMLDIDASMSRDKAVANALGRRPEFQPRRRGDVDFIFISGRPTQDRLMASMFRYWRADTLPIYATADVNTGTGDNDLAGIRFCDDPWLLEPGPEWDAERARIAQATPGQAVGYQRLYALGMDAARLVKRLRQGAMLPGEEVSGDTGELSLAPDGVVRRRLACAQVVADAAPRPIDATILPVPGQGAVMVPDATLPGQSDGGAGGGR